MLYSQLGLFSAADLPLNSAVYSLLLTLWLDVCEHYRTVFFFFLINRERDFYASMQLTCGEGQRAGGARRQEDQAQAQHGSHFPVLLPSGFRVLVLVWLRCRPLPRARTRNYARRREEKQEDNARA